MDTSGKKPPGAGGGSVAIRGFLVQTLVALLEVVRADPPCTEITLEPAIGDEQFDFVWKDGTRTYAVQVKSTTNFFDRYQIEQWARKMEAARSTEHCRLMLVGIIHQSLAKVTRVGKVSIENKNLDLPAFIREAAHLLAEFLEAENGNAGTASERKMIVKSLVTELELYSTESRTLTREDFIEVLRQWITAAPRQELGFDISRIDKYAPAELIGRENETKLLSDTWDKAVSGESGRPHVLTFVALGGEGKTALVAKWAAELAGKDWPGCEAALAWSFYSQGTREQMAASSDLFLKESLVRFGDPEMAKSAQGAFEKGRRLAQLVGQRRALLILDGLEPLQYAPASPTPGELKDQGIQALLKGLAATNKGLCLVTTRYSVADLKAYRQAADPEIELRRLSRLAGVDLLQSFDVKGSLRKNIPSPDGKEQWNEFEKLVEDVKGHALTLNLLGTYLRDAHAGDIRKRDLVKLEEADIEEQGGHAFHVMDAYVISFEKEGKKGKRALALLSLLGLFDRPAEADCLEALLKVPAIPGLTEEIVDLNEAQRNMALTRLESAKLITIHRDAAGMLVSLDAHPLVREYFARRLRKENNAAWKAGHKRLYEHLCETTKEGDEPTLEDLQPLYQAVAHGCHAGLQREARAAVYRDRIMRGKEAYAVKKLGAFGSDLGAVACFFETPWSRVSPALTQADQAWLLNEAAFSLRALGRLTEALEPMRAAIEGAVRLEDWNNAAIYTGNLSELELTLGFVDQAVTDGERIIDYTESSKRWGVHWYYRCSYADALHKKGHQAEAKVCFGEVEEMQAKNTGHALLYSVRGFRYCELLLSEVERVAWQKSLRSEDGGRRTELIEQCRHVEQRAEQTLKLVTGKLGLLDEALEHLTLGRAVLYRAILEESAIRAPKSEIELAVDGLRRAGTTHHMPRGLLTRAWLRLLDGDPAGSARDLDEAWEIAERGPMKLHMVDIHLYRARLFGKTTEYPWDSPQADLDEAARLIQETGYHRRDEELADAIEAAKSWNNVAE